MPWRTPELLTMKTEFVMLADQEQTNMRALCQRFGISTVCGYKWLRAFREQGAAGLQEKSRRPNSHPEQSSQQMEQRILEFRARHPAWGPASSDDGCKTLGSKGRRPARSPRSCVAWLWARREKKQGPWQRFEYGAPNECGRWTSRDP